MGELKQVTELDRRILDRLVPVAAAPDETGLPAVRDAHWYARQAYADNTYRAYRAGVHDFARWTNMSFPFPATPELIGAYLAARADQYAIATLEQRLHAISFAHRALGEKDPTKDDYVKAVLKGIKRDRATQGAHEQDQAPAFSLADFRAMVDGIGREKLADLRDRAYLMVGLYGAFRQSEMTGLTVEQLAETDQGIAVRMGKVKQDQEGRFKYVKALPYVEGSDYCPVAALKAWLDAAGIDKGPVFRGISRWGKVSARALSHTATNDLIKKRARAALLPNAGEYSGHSLRASFVTIMRDMEVPDALIARQTHHRNLQMMTVYDRVEDAFRQTPVVDLGGWLADALMPGMN